MKKIATSGPDYGRGPAIGESRSGSSSVVGARPDGAGADFHCALYLHGRTGWVKSLGRLDPGRGG